ncbi:hypothetical protein LTR78_010285 [Recurvomyces mirabilis]|uniref:Uncharacterized protein n=1 Tax=Recurvomyces mirabilis TaxID=574656 RepID=A0AAE0TMP3_9PEZI|nr:hypothetical protein LTR78_010285 [Recurvomyces mirabilis]KAK5149645.1 hypothetical protein LTS14_010776 [Recurvomyces mirabilis]
MQQTFLPSGRVKWFPKCEWLGDGLFRSLLTGKEYGVGSQTKVVETNYVKVEVPAMRPPPYAVATGVDLVAPNDLANTTTHHAHYTICGAGKTGIDSCLWLLNNGVDPDNITWIMPRDPMYLDRSSLQPGEQFAERVRERIKRQSKAIMLASSMNDCIQRLKECGQLIQLDEDITPMTFHAAIVTTAELEQFHQIKDVVRKGRIVSISADKVEMTKESYVPVSDTLYVDCTATALLRVPPVSVFQGNKIVLQTVRFCQPVFSAALIGFIEKVHDDDTTKNELCRPVRYPDVPKDYPLLQLQTHLNTIRWSKDEKLVE